MNGEAVKNKINAAFDKLKALLEERRKFMIGIVNKDLKKKKDVSGKWKDLLKLANKSLNTYNLKTKKNWKALLKI